ncbi:unnamed protein product [Sympodiomycopsis kandeliae]
MTPMRVRVVHPTCMTARSALDACCLRQDSGTISLVKGLGRNAVYPYSSRASRALRHTIPLTLGTISGLKIPPGRPPAPGEITVDMSLLAVETAKRNDSVTLGNAQGGDIAKRSVPAYPCARTYSTKYSV